MSTSLHKSGVLGGAAKEDNKASESDSTGKKSCGEEIVLQLEDKLVSAKSEMNEVMEENQRLRMCLNRILEDYRTLEMQYRDVIAQEAKKSPTTVPTHQDQTEEPELIALSLGRTSSGKIRDERNKVPTVEKSDEGNEGLALGLDCKVDVPKMLSQAETTSLNPSPENSLEEVKEEGEEKRKNKAMNNAGDGGDDEVLQQSPVKRARVSVRVRCDTPTMNDGCQWRKYGQKIAKGNPCPRAYYRCTVAPSCPVRKQVQRCVEDMSILITTYEGTHNHPLSVSATAMASTTSAAASMLLSGSSMSGGPSSSSTTSNLNGLNFYISENSRSRPFYLPNSSISSSSSYPTITLDLTASSSSSSSHLSRLGNFPRRYPPTNLNFSSLQSSAVPVVSWSNNAILSYGTQPCSKNQSTTSLSFQANPNETLYQSYLQKNTMNPNQQTLAPDTIAAATKAITLDPSFQSALAAALSSIIGSGGTNSSTTASKMLSKNLKKV
ncbi:UNVERIFIED_CONTAM: WRKY transcription factor 72A [Sesamum angustifolium]|uniref:WRKY transcription factor 72A n=1 Tax=Sesamum angustifolium TaxID=2727405 RepID=A0AAW2Q9Z9_9LAMI